MINPIRETIILSLLPVSELRGAIPFAVYKGISIYHAFIIAIIANFFVIPFLFFFLAHLHEYFMQNNYYRVVFNKYIEKKRCVLERLHSSHLWYTKMRHATISWIQLNDYLSHFTIIYF